MSLQFPNGHEYLFVITSVFLAFSKLIVHIFNVIQIVVLSNSFFLKLFPAHSWLVQFLILYSFLEKVGGGLIVNDVCGIIEEFFLALEIFCT